jgi:oxygen-independent coproporphyrinogen-3 oxidase
MAQMPDGEIAPRDGLLPASAALGSSERTLHAYLHIPFCRVRCGYCDYNTYTSSELQGVTENSFLNNLLREITLSKNVLETLHSEQRKFSTVFFGGGTPTQLEAEQLALVLETLKSEFGLEKNAEVTTEANPDTVDERYLNTLAEAGFTRVSIGMQSSVSSVLKILDRTHNPENVAKAVVAAKSAGLQVSVDLIYGTPGESLDDWRESLATAINLDPDHISA